MLHNMLLIHDDLEDGDEVRRDRPTVWFKYGMPHAVNAGDYLLGLAYSAVLRTSGRTAGLARQLAGRRLLEAFNFAYLRTVEGQALDIRFRARPDFGVEAYRKMAELKTGYYLALGMVGGAIVAGADEATIERLWHFGKCAGPAFQVRDDLLDMTAEKGRGGKIGSDIEEGKPSILYAHALQALQTASGGRERAELIRVMALPRHATTPADVRRVIELYHRCGSVAFARSFAEELLEQACADIRALPLVRSELLTDLTDYLVERRK
jgi:geranylgeranyl pyrophosphate synthase